MKNVKNIVAVMFSVIILATGCSDKEAVKDSVSDGAETTKQEEQANEKEKQVIDKKIIAGTVMSAQLLDLLEIDVVGVPTTKKGLPERFNGVTDIGMSMKPDAEKVASLDPDVFISDFALKDSVDQVLGENGVETIYLKNNSYEDVMTTLTTLGDYFGKQQKAEQIIKDMKDNEEKVLKRIEGKENPRVMVLFGTTESFMLSTNNSFVGSLIEKLGATNVTDELSKGAPTPYVPFSLEQAVSLNPDIILRLTHMEVEASRAAFDKEFTKGLWQNMKPVQEGKVYDLDPEFFGVTANSRASESLEKLGEILYK